MPNKYIYFFYYYFALKLIINIILHRALTYVFSHIFQIVVKNIQFYFYRPIIHFEFKILNDKIEYVVQGTVSYSLQNNTKHLLLKKKDGYFINFIMVSRTVDRIDITYLSINIF